MFLLGHFGKTWSALWAAWDRIGASWERLGIALGMPWDYSGPLPWEQFWGCLGQTVFAGTPTASRWLSSTAPAHKNKPAGSMDDGGPSVPSVMVSGTTLQTLPSTRAGDEDDASFINSLKLNLD